jgi:hypothetical protein
MSLVKYELGFYIPEEAIHHSHCCEKLKSYNEYGASVAVGILKLISAVTQRQQKEEPLKY